MCSPTRKGHEDLTSSCLLYTSDAADEEDSVDLGGRRIIKKNFNVAVLISLLINKVSHKCIGAGSSGG